MTFFILFFVLIAPKAFDAEYVSSGVENMIVEEENLKDECAVEIVYVAYVDDTVVVTWIPVKSSCSSNPVYKVQYRINENVTDFSDTLTEDMPTALLVVGKLRCENVFVKVLVIEKESVVGESNEKMLDRNLDNITGLNVEQKDNGLHVTWKPLHLGDPCIVTYTIQYVVGETDEEEDLKTPGFVIPLVKDKPCIPYDIKVFATSNNLKSKPGEIVFEIGIPAVKDVVLKNREDKVLVDFKPPEDVPDECGNVDYRVIQKDKACFKSDFIIVPVSSTGYEGVATGKSIIRRPKAIQKLDISPKDDKVYLTWETPVGGKECNMVYFIRFSHKIYNVHTTNFIADLALRSCKTDVLQVAPAIVVGQDYVEGQSAYLELAGDLGSVAFVKCSLKPKTVECWWRKPLKSDYCKRIVYEVAYFDGYSKKSDKTHDTMYIFEVDDTWCNFWFNVQPIAFVNDKMWEGDVIEATIEGCVTNLTEIEYKR